MQEQAAVYEALGDAQRLGFLGDHDIADVIEHARLFVGALDGLDARPVGTRPRVADLGAGGGVPGLVIGLDRPDCDLTLIDRRTKRTDFLERIVRRLGWSDRVRVAAVDASRFAEDEGGTYDAVVARGFGPPAITLSLAVKLLRPGGRAVISDPPFGDRWSEALLEELGVARQPGDRRIAVFTRRPRQ